MEIRTFSVQEISKSVRIRSLVQGLVTSRTPDTYFNGIISVTNAILYKILKVLFLNVRYLDYFYAFFRFSSLCGSDGVVSIRRSTSFSFFICVFCSFLSRGSALEDSNANESDLDVSRCNLPLEYFKDMAHELSEFGKRRTNQLTF